MKESLCKLSSSYPYNVIDMPILFSKMWCVTRDRDNLEEFRTMPHFLIFLASGKLSWMEVKQHPVQITRTSTKGAYGKVRNDWLSIFRAYIISLYFLSVRLSADGFIIAIINRYYIKMIVWRNDQVSLSTEFPRQNTDHIAQINYFLTVTILIL